MLGRRADVDDMDVCIGQNLPARQLQVSAHYVGRDHADARAEVVADPTLLKEAIEESLRFNTSAQRFKRCLQKRNNFV